MSTIIDQNFTVDEIMSEVRRHKHLRPEAVDKAGILDAESIWQLATAG